MGVRSPVHIIALGEVLGALAFVRAGPAAPQAYEVSQELERKPERPLATIRQIRLQAPTRQKGKILLLLQRYQILEKLSGQVTRTL